MSVGIRYARQRGIEVTNDVCVRFPSILRPAIKAALTRPIDDVGEVPQLIPPLGNARGGWVH
jgi:hypothetical protein